jgi:RNA polymerase sigma factor (sigma-70 family)
MPAIVPFALSSIKHEPLARDDQTSSRERVWQAIHRLSDRLAQVVILRFYGEEGKPLKLGQIGSRLGISDERVRQLLQQAYRELRAVCDE